MMELNIALCGFGTVGKGVYRILEENGKVIEKKSGIKFNVKYVLVRNIEKHKREFQNVNFISNFNKIINDDSVKIVVELIGGDEIAKEIVCESLKKGKSVVTANKAILAGFGDEVIKLAEENNADIFFEASVAGSIPIIKILKESLSSNNISLIYGILNGTSNFILTKMTEENRDFKTVLKEAQERGYAEADPTLDIEGLDAGHKLSILMSIAFNTIVDYNKIYTEGISNISTEDIKFADELGYIIKLLAIAKFKDNLLEGRVHPTLINKDSLLASVKYENNALYLVGEYADKQFYFGKGAGRFPTASVVVSDIIEAGINIKNNCRARRPFYSVFSRNFENIELLPISEITTKYYMRFNAVDKPGVLSKISGVLGNYNISIEAVIQKGRDLENRGSVPIVMITHEAKEKNVKEALKIIDNLNVVKAPTVLYRIENNL